MKLFAIYVGGAIQGANIEQHDMRFAVAECIEDTYDALRRQWWGTPGSLHIDCWSEISRADGYEVTLRPEPSNDNQKLYYVNVGGYDGKEFMELHKNCFVVAESESKAKIRALKLVRHWTAFHKDDLLEAEQVIALQKIEEPGLYVHLVKTDDDTPAPFSCFYKKIGSTKRK